MEVRSLRSIGARNHQEADAIYETVDLPSRLGDLMQDIEAAGGSLTLTEIARAPRRSISYDALGAVIDHGLRQGQLEITPEDFRVSLKT